MLLQGKVAIITGASRGIGRAIALTLAQNGASLMINANREDLLKRVVQEVEGFGQKCLITKGDISNINTSKKIVSNTIDKFGKIDILVNNAGINMRIPTLELKSEDWQSVINTNLNGTFYSCSSVLPYMIQQKYGKIINISSTTAKTPHRNASPSYGASKAGINYLTQHLALEMAKYNICVNAVCPGPIETDMSDQWSPKYREQVLSRIPLGRLGKPYDVANTVLFLVSSMADFITGESININGGTYMN
ncbi:3-oxoacyl-[acyl-carrier-protein] reductase FabG [Clostridium ragsdalei P11]|uniref:3-oxoacyl-[acyl-carrier-protein] reductase FabG n=1 Tax=Clostridium ragsdalei P11 TaxID=1353534 RepID=A0A1A6APB2_9CLOT|nr:SDR family NAD(P)-dependent oxidoreductase [Clostridium ragsdalei]OBR91909.1 3-oxoacyl-[acyl-carrier-protein] reductase FabG [Clostridium ragsdalei P11]